MENIGTIKRGIWPTGNVEFLLVTVGCILYIIMVFFGLGSFWKAFNPANLYTILLTFPVVFLLNTYLFIPLFKRKRNWLIYLLSLFLLMLFIELIRTLVTVSGVSIIFKEQKLWLSFFLGLFFSWIWVTVRDWWKNIRLIERLQAEKMQSELDFLKVQVDPHFLFNTLNSLYALALEEDSPKTADSIIKLSALMRYNLHDTNEEQISIEKEIDYIEKYIALQKLRLNADNRVVLKIAVQDQDHKALKIAPLLLIPFVENVFKYGVSPSKPSEMHIELVVNDHAIVMTTQNEIHAIEPSDHSGGVGLRNVRNRLALFYPGKHSLSAERRGNQYFTHLKIHLNK